MFYSDVSGDRRSFGHSNTGDSRYTSHSDIRHSYPLSQWDADGSNTRWENYWLKWYFVVLLNWSEDCHCDRISKTVLISPFSCIIPNRKKMQTNNTILTSSSLYYPPPPTSVTHISYIHFSFPNLFTYSSPRLP